MELVSLAAAAVIALGKAAMTSAPPASIDGTKTLEDQTPAPELVA